MGGRAQRNNVEKSVRYFNNAVKNGIFLIQIRLPLNHFTLKGPISKLGTTFNHKT